MLELNDNNFIAEVENYDGTALVDFWAVWCGPCRAQAPILESLQDEMPKLKIGKLNVDEYPEIARRFGVQMIPTLVVFKGGKETSRAIGTQSLTELKKLIN